MAEVSEDGSRAEPLNITMINDKIILSCRVVQLLYMPKLEESKSVVSLLFYMM